MKVTILAHDKKGNMTSMEFRVDGRLVIYHISPGILPMIEDDERDDKGNVVHEALQT